MTDEESIERVKAVQLNVERQREFDELGAQLAQAHACGSVATDAHYREDVGLRREVSEIKLVLESQDLRLQETYRQNQILREALKFWLNYTGDCADVEFEPIAKAALAASGGEQPTGND